MKEEKKEKKKFFESKRPCAKKDFVLSHNDFHMEIKEGDELDEKKLEKFWENLKTEGVL